MGRLPVFKYRDLAAALRKGGAQCIRQTGSHRIWSYNGQEFSIPAHSDGSDVLSVYIRGLRAAWGLKNANGVSDDDFRAGRWKR